MSSIDIGSEAKKFSSRPVILSPNKKISTHIQRSRDASIIKQVGSLGVPKNAMPMFGSAPSINCSKGWIWHGGPAN